MGLVTGHCFFCSPSLLPCCWALFLPPVSYLSPPLFFMSLTLSLQGSYHRRPQLPFFFILQRNLVFFVFLHPLRLYLRNLIFFFHQKGHWIICLNIVTPTLELNYASLLECKISKVYNLITSDLKLKLVKV